MNVRQPSIGVSLLFTFIWFLSSPSGLSTQEAQKEIVEHVSVNWWQVPVFAVDSSGKPIIDLKAGDIEVYVNGHRVEDFVFYKRAFSVTLAEEETVPVDEPTERQKAPVMKKNAIFLLFDLTLSSDTCVRRSQEVAEEIIKKASPDIRFVLLTMEPFKGLHYICGPEIQKEKLLNKLKSEITRKMNRRTVDSQNFFRSSSNNAAGPASSRSRSAMTENELKGLQSQAGFYYMRKSLGFFNTFESLYLLFNALDDNKFVYLFSEGLSNDFKQKVMGGTSMYNSFLRKAAKQLGRSGVVLFVVNPMGVTDDTDINKTRVKSQEPGKAPVNPLSETSGEDSLRYLAKESGGKYLEGVRTKIVKTLENMHHAYYEISFSDVAALKGDTRGVDIKLKRKGVRIHTLRSLEKSKTYTQMDRMEQEIFVLNLVSQNQLLKPLMPFDHVRVTRIRTGEAAVEYTIKLPEDFLHQNLDLYKFWVKDTGMGMETQTVTHMEKASLHPEKRKVAIKCQLTEENTRNSTPYFALIDSQNNRALVRVIGDSWVDDDSDEEKARPAKQEKLKNAPSISPEEMTRILTGAARYCDNLKESAFHFLCKEEIAETHNPLSSSTTRRNARAGYFISSKSTRPAPGLPSTEAPQTTVTKFVFSYRLLKNDETIAEERQWMTTQKDRPADVKKEQVINTTAFFSERAVFAPTTMLAADRQILYRFKFTGYEDYKGRRCAVIDGFPIDPHTTNGFYGKTWIDTEDYSVLKVVANPRSINGYSRLKELADTLKTRLYLSLEMVFDFQREGIRFPTRASMTEKYKGGRMISQFKGAIGWERTRTEFRYSDYRFFNVKTDVIVED